MHILYTIVIHVFYFSMLLLARFNQKARLWVSGRKNWRGFLQGQQKLKHPVFWFHAASLGEYEQGLPLMEALRKAIPGCSIAISFFSPSGYEVRKNTPYADLVFYLPLDTRHNAVDLVDLLKPDAAFFIKYEFWYFFLDTLKKRGISAYLLSGIFRHRQVYFKWYGWWFRKSLHAFRYIFAQNDTSVRLLKTIGIDHVAITGDTRFDRVMSNAAKAMEIPAVEQFSKGSVCVVAGSTWPADEELLLGFINSAPSGVKFIIAPHEIGQNHIAQLIKGIRRDMVLFSLAGTTTVSDKQVMIIDNVGMLSSIYRYGRIAYIGGGFGKGIHNLLEAAVYGIPVVFGPNFSKFQEAIELIATGGGFTISNSEELANILNKLTMQEQFHSEAAQRAKIYVEHNAGATAKVLSHVLPEINNLKITN